MTVNTTTRLVRYVGNGATTVFPFNFRIPQSDQIIVSLQNSITGEIQQILAPGAYTVAGIGNPAGGTVTYNPGTPIPVTTAIIIERLMPFTQNMDIENQGGFYPEVVEQQLDFIVMQIQQLAELQNRSMIVNPGEVPPNITDLLALIATAGVNAARAEQAALIAESFAQGLTPQFFGAKGDGTTDDTLAMLLFAAAFDAARLIAPINWTIPAKRYRCSDRIRFSAAGAFRSTLNMTSAEFICNFNRSLATKFFIEFGNSDLPTSSSSTIDINGRLYITKGPNCTWCPVAVYFGVSGQSSMDKFALGSGWNNTGFYMEGVQNVSFQQFKMFSGGNSFLYADTTGSAFRQTGLQLDRVSGSFSFPTSCVGKVIQIQTGTSFRKVTITAWISATSVTVDYSTTDGIDSTVLWGSPAPTTVLGSPDVVLDGPVDANMVGMYVGIPRADTGGKTLWAFIIAANAGTSTITLDRTAKVNLSPGVNAAHTTQIASCVLALRSNKISDGGPFTNGISQVRIYDFQIETFRGVALGVDDAEFVDIFSMKCHGNSSPTGSTYALAAIWANRLSGTGIIQFDQQMLGMERMVFADMSQNFAILHLAARMRRNERLLRVQPYLSAGGVVTFGIYAPTGIDDTQTFADWIFDSNPSNAPGYCIPDKILSSAGGPIDFDMVPQAFVPVVADAATGGNVATVGSASGTYYRVGKKIFGTIRLTNIVTTGLTAGNNIYVRGLPKAVRGGTANLVVAAMRYSGISGAAPVAFADDGDTWFLFYPANSTTPVLVSAVTSGTNTMMFSFEYMMQ